MTPRLSMTRRLKNQIEQTIARGHESMTTACTRLGIAEETFLAVGDAMDAAVQDHAAHAGHCGGTCPHALQDVNV